MMIEVVKILEAQGEWVILEKQEKTSSGFIVTDGNSGTVISVGKECPESFKSLVGEEVVYSQVRTVEELEGYIAVNWREVFWRVIE